MGCPEVKDWETEGSTMYACEPVCVGGQGRRRSTYLITIPVKRPMGGRGSEGEEGALDKSERS